MKYFELKHIIGVVALAAVLTVTAVAISQAAETGRPVSKAAASWECPFDNLPVSSIAAPLAAGSCDGSRQRVGNCNGNGNGNRSRNGNGNGNGRRGNGRGNGNGKGSGNGNGNGNCRR